LNLKQSLKKNTTNEFQYHLKLNFKLIIIGTRRFSVRLPTIFDFYPSNRFTAYLTLPTSTDILKLLLLNKNILKIIFFESICFYELEISIKKLKLNNLKTKKKEFFDVINELLKLLKLLNRIFKFDFTANEHDKNCNNL